MCRIIVVAMGSLVRPAGVVEGAGAGHKLLCWAYLTGACRPCRLYAEGGTRVAGADVAQWQVAACGLHLPHICGFGW